MPTFKHLTLWDALIWVYRKQRAHIYLSTGQLCFDWAVASGYLTEDGPRPTVHWDAAMIHAAVSEIGEEHGQHMAEAIILPAYLREPPELPDSQPTPMPYEIDGPRKLRAGRAPEYTLVEVNPSKQRPPMSRPGRGIYRGKRVDILIKTLDFDVSYRPIFERRGRGRMTQVGTEPVWEPREYCPLRWEPDLSWHAASIGTYKAWRTGMMMLAEKIPTLELKEHRIEIEEIP